MRPAILLASLLLASSARADPEPAGTAQIPLAELLRLHRDLDRAQREPPPKEPLAAVLERVELTALLLDDAAELTAHLEAQVFTDAPSVLPLLQRGPGLNVLSLPRLEHGALSIRGGSLALLTQRAGAYAFELGLRASARIEGQRRHVRIGFAPATAASLKLTYDPGLFRLEAPNAVPLADGALLFAEDGAFSFAWEPLAPAASRARRLEPRRPAIEPVVERARASVVATLAGRRITRVLYELKLEGAQPIRVRLPEGYRVERVFVNGAAREAAAQDGALALEVGPERAGDTRGRLELLLAEEPERFKLKGGLRFTLPTTSWRSDDYLVELFLPEVFTYRWQGGSLSPCAAPPDPAEFTSPLPTPGKPLCLRQALVFEPPTAEVGYQVDLAGKYWAGPTTP